LFMMREEDLRRALRREEPPAGFAERVLARAVPAAPARRWWWQRPAQFIPVAAVLAALFLAVGIGWQRRQHEQAQQEQAQQAGRQLNAALNITRNRLQKTQERIRRIAAKPVI
jgi:uncharacterized protein HemX